MLLILSMKSTNMNESTQQVGSLPKFLRHGNTDEDVVLNSMIEIQENILLIINQSLRKLKIFTPNMESNIYDNQLIEESLLAFARGNRHANIQILVQDIDEAIHYGHALIRLSQKLTSSMEIRAFTDNSMSERHSYIVSDNAAFLYRGDYQKDKGLMNLNCKHRNEALTELFDTGWRQAEQEKRIQRLSI